jgi:diacylglycerol O-acyltransferase / wax synthase
MSAPVKTQKLGSADVAWLRMDAPTNPMTIVGLLALGAPMPIGQVKELIRDRLLIFERFRQKLDDLDGTPKWVTDETFDLDGHVHRVGLPAPGGKEALEELVGDLMSDRLDLSKPPWQFHVVEDYEGGVVLVARVHHTIGDGIALVHVLLSMADEYFADFDRSRIPTYGSIPEKRSLVDSLMRPVGKTVTGVGRLASSVVRGAFDAAQNPGKVFEAARAGLSMAAAASHIALLPYDSDTRFKGDVGVIKRVSWSEPIALRDVKAIGEAAGAKVNDVLLSAVAGGLRRYLVEEGDPVDGVEIGAVVPVNLRPMSSAFELGNQFGIVFLSLPIGIAEASDRLRAVQERMEVMKASAEPIVAYGILQAIGAGPNGLHRQVVDILSSKSSAVMTNVPGPEEQLHFFGVPLNHVMFWVPRGGTVGLGVAIISYNDTVRLGIATDAKMAPRPRAIVEGLHAEFDALKAEFDGTVATRRKRRVRGEK